MRRLIIAFLLTTLTAIESNAQRQSSIRIELASAISSNIFRASFGHQIGNNWSIESETGININRLIKGKDNETNAHWNALSDTDSFTNSRTFRENFTEVSISVQYWPKLAYEGIMFCVGGTIKDRAPSDINAGIGYLIRIWKGLRADLQYKINIIETAKSQTMQLDGIRIGISYVF